MAKKKVYRSGMDIPQKRFGLADEPKILFCRKCGTEIKEEV